MSSRRTLLLGFSLLHVIPAAATEPEEDQILVTRDFGNDAVTYATSGSSVTVQRRETDDRASYDVAFTAEDGSVRSFEFDATPSVDTFEIVGLEQADILCGRTIAVITLREFFLVEGPGYLYTNVFIELTHPNAATEYLDENASEIGGPTPLGLIETYADIDCSVFPLTVDARE